ncbi:hypothetical protein B0H10DRAFT_2441868 [Mycena sp. CBHHK59/15]|nr:hypothetical protein B0H10DRAFT_2441868 [Mycena sp. CBHHK59/15]
MAPKLKDQFYDLGQMQNKSHKITYCKGCVDHRLQSVGATAADLINSSQAFKDACAFVTPTRGENESTGDNVTKRAQGVEGQIIGEEAHACRFHRHPGPPSKKQQTQSTLSSLTFRRNDMPYGTEEKDALQKQALRTIISSGSPFGLFEDQEMQILFGMIRTTAPGILPTGKVVGGRLLNGAAEDIELRLNKRLKNRNVGLCTDGWKSQRKDSVNALCANIDFKARNNHKSTATLLSVPRYRDLLEDQDDEDSTERGRALVTSVEGWRTEVAKWIGDTRAAERMETELVSEGEANDEFSSRLPTRVPAWKPMTLQVLFGAEKPRKRRPSKRVMEEEEQLMEALANAEEDDVPDDGAIEIDTKFREMRENMGLYRTKKQGHDVDSIRDAMIRLRAQYPRAGQREISGLLFHEEDMSVSRAVITSYFAIYVPDLVRQRRANRLKRKRFWAAGVNDLWAVDQHDKWKYKFGLALHSGLDPFIGRIQWLKIWWTNSNPRLILSYYLDAVQEFGFMPLVSQSDPGSENFGLANGHTLLRHWHDQSLFGTLQHRWMNEKKNVVAPDGTFYMGGVNNGLGLDSIQSDQLDGMMNRDEPLPPGEADVEEDDQLIAWFSDEEDAASAVNDCMQYAE